MRELIITADDLGYCIHRDNAIFQAHLHGLVQNSSLLLNGSSTKSAVLQAKKQNLLLGLHLNLTEGIPISHKYKYKHNQYNQNQSLNSLTDAKTNLFKGKHGFRNSLLSNEITWDDLHDEIESQIRYFKELTGTFPYYLDGHQHCHVANETIVNIIGTLMNHYDIRFIRLPIEDIIYNYITPQSKCDFYKNIINESRKALLIYQNEYNIINPQLFIGLNIMGFDQTFANIYANFNAKLLTATNIIDEIDDSDSDDEKNFGINEIGKNDLCCEWMTHPGYACKEGCLGILGIDGGSDEFARSKAREFEFNNLMKNTTENIYISNFLFNNEHFRLCSYKTSKVLARLVSSTRFILAREVLLSKRLCGNFSNYYLQSRPTVLIFGVLIPFAGNSITVERLRIIFNEYLNFNVIVIHTSKTEDNNISHKPKYFELEQLISDYNVKYIIGLHALHSGKWLAPYLEKYKNMQKTGNYNASGIKFWIIFGGTDLNSSQNKINSSIIDSVINNSDRLIAFNDSLKSKAMSKLKNTRNAQKLVKIPQSIHLPSNFDSNNHNKPHNMKSLLNINNENNEYLLLLVCGLRLVKDPMFIIDSLIKFNLSNTCKMKLNLLIIGNILDKSIFDSLIAIKHCKVINYFEKLKNINVNNIKSRILIGNEKDDEFKDDKDKQNKFIFLLNQALPRNYLLSIMNQSDIILNTSRSEGQSNALLEAMLLGKPIVARNNSGNVDIVEHGYNGLIFGTPQQCIDQCVQVLRDRNMQAKFREYSQKYVEKNHSFSKEMLAYSDMMNINACLTSKL